MQNELETAIEALQKVLVEQEKKVSETKTTINNLAQMLGKSPIYTDVGSDSSTSTISTIQSDTFYGKTVIVAAREYLEMRKASGAGPAPIKEIFEALKHGGFMFNSKSDSNSQIVLRSAISKASSIFHRLPNGHYGLVKWYDLAKIKRFKGTADTADETEDEIETSDSQEEESDVA